MYTLLYIYIYIYCTILYTTMYYILQCTIYCTVFYTVYTIYTILYYKTQVLYMGLILILTWTTYTITNIHTHIIPPLYHYYRQLTQQIAELQRLQKTAEATIRQLRTELTTTQKELTASQAKERTRTHSEDGKIQGFLQKITRLDEELVAARYVLYSICTIRYYNKLHYMHYIIYLL